MLYKRRMIVSSLLLIMVTILSSCGSDQPVSPQGTEKKTGRVETTETIETTESDALVAIPLILPRAMIIGGFASAIRVPGGKLEKLRDTMREPFLAPAGVTNVAGGKPVSASEEFPICGEVGFITDGDKDGSDGSYVDFGPFQQYVTIDLEQRYELYAIVVWHYHRQPRAYFDVVVQIADDPDFMTNVRTLFNNDHDNSAGLGVGADWHYVETFEGKLIDAKGEKARYVRLYSDGNSSGDWNIYVEVEVFGK